jgi:anti-sigma factor RsiW
MSKHDPADLPWLAFQYVNDELSPDETAQFEERLATDQAAREAVAESMLLVQAVSAGARMTPASAQRSWKQHAAWAAVGAAACLATIFVVRTFPTQGEMAARPQIADVASTELALVWANSEGYSEIESPEAADEDHGLAADTREIDREFVVPGWMMEALSTPSEVKPAVKESQES